LILLDRKNHDLFGSLRICMLHFHYRKIFNLGLDLATLFCHISFALINNNNKTVGFLFNAFTSDQNILGLLHLYFCHDFQPC
jgi:hypothetical protein